jgi:hypothetical protein
MADDLVYAKPCLAQYNTARPQFANAINALGVASGDRAPHGASRSGHGSGTIQRSYGPYYAPNVQF